nr:helix-turn-helix transcriptional regulator [Lentzea kentuckyensis]
MTSRTPAVAVRRQELRDFLRSCRARLTPSDVGLAVDGRRRTPGLRREEVAVLANVGLSWYTWLEQGKDINVSERVLDAVSQALRLSHAERVHLFHLAGLAPPTSTTESSGDDVGGLRVLVDGWSPNPAYLLDRHWNIVAANAAARRAFSVAASHENCFHAFFLDPGIAEFYPQEERLARELVAQLRDQIARYPDDQGLQRLVLELSASSDRFVSLWQLQELVETPMRSVWFRHPLAGVLTFDQVVLTPAGRPDHRLMIYTPDPATATAERLSWLDRLVVPVPR